MIHKQIPTRVGYKLTYDAECLYDNWLEIGGCCCFLGCAPCRSCTDEGNPLSLEENDEVWEIDEEVEDMSRQDIKDKSDPPKSKWFNGKYRVNPETSKLLQEAVFADGGSWAGEQTEVLYPDETIIVVYPNGKMYKGYSDFNIIRFPEKQPPQSIKEDALTCTLYVKFKGSISGKYEGKEYAYKCTKEQYEEVKANFANHVYAEVEVSGNLKAVLVITGGQEVDPEATKSIVRIVKESVDTEVESGKISTSEQALKDAFEKAIKLGEDRLNSYEPVSVTSNYGTLVVDNKAVGTLSNIERNVSKFNQQEESNMRKLVDVQLFDDSKGLPVQDSLVAEFNGVLTEDDTETTIREVIMNNDLKSILELHNAKRQGVINLDIQERTGNNVTLQPILLKNLRWVVKG